MADGQQPRPVRDVEATCSGPEDAPHAPVRLRLPPGTVVVCTLCRLSYRREAGWPRVTRAHWPRVT